MTDVPKIFTLKQVVSSIRKTIEDRYQHLYWVKAEMHKLNRFPSGHCFPELLQKDEGKIVAQISGSIWKHNFGNNPSIQNKHNSNVVIPTFYRMKQKNTVRDIFLATN